MCGRRPSRGDEANDTAIVHQQQSGKRHPTPTRFHRRRLLCGAEGVSPRRRRGQPRRRTLEDSAAAGQLPARERLDAVEALAAIRKRSQSLI